MTLSSRRRIVGAPLRSAAALLLVLTLTACGSDPAATPTSSATSVPTSGAPSSEAGSSEAPSSEAASSETSADVPTSAEVTGSSSATETPGSSSSAETSAGAAGEGLPATVDTMYGEIQIPKPADGELTVVSLGWSDAEVALALGVKPVAVYDWLSFGEATKGVGSWAVDEFGDETPVVFKNVDQTYNYEQIDSLNPDLILNVNSAPNQDAYDRLSQIAPTVYAQEGAQPYAVGWKNQVEIISAALGESDAGEALITSTQKVIDDAKAAHPEFAGKTAVSGSKFGDAYGVSLPGDFRADLLIDLGFTLPPAVDELESNGFFATVPAEQVGVFDQQVAVLYPIGFTLAELQDDELIASLSVVKDGRAVLLDPAGDAVNAFSAASPLSIPVAVSELVPQLAEAAAKAG